MAESKKNKENFFVVIYNYAFKEIRRYKYTKTKFIMLVLFVLITLSIINFFIISYTPIKFLVPGYPNKETILMSQITAIKLDSIKHELEVKNQYITNILKILKGDSLDNYTNDTIIKDTNIDYKSLDMSISKNDSILRKEVEQKEMFNISNTTNLSYNINLYQINFYPPLKGVISNSFAPLKGHYGIDIVSKPNTSVSAVLDGTVIGTFWSLEAGYTIQIQHFNNVVTVYKHLANIIVKQGEHVKTGQPIAFVGNTGELSSGTHLHFEMWYGGKPLNPEDFISFNQ
jgi:murein DD-endopeptidase MepM/ murein hydrolase activator NlpD